MKQQQIIAWLLEGDVSIQYQVWRDLLGVDKKELQGRITKQRMAVFDWGHLPLSIVMFV